MENEIPVTKEENKMTESDDSKSNRNILSDQVLAFIEYFIVVLLIHMIIFTVAYYFIDNEDYVVFVGMILFVSFITFTSNYRNNPPPMDELDIYNIGDEQLPNF